jgi:hypothetical protein
VKGIVTALAVGFGLAALYGISVCDGPAKPSQAAGGAAKVADGKPVFVKYKCRSCHSIEAQGITKKALGEEAEGSGSKPPDLSGVGVERNADWIAAFLLKKEKLEGKLHEKKFRGTQAELQKLAAWLATMDDEAAAKKMKATEGKNASGKAAEPAETEEKAEPEKSETKSDK